MRGHTASPLSCRWWWQELGDPLDPANVPEACCLRKLGLCFPEGLMAAGPHIQTALLWGRTASVAFVRLGSPTALRVLGRL